MLFGGYVLFVPPVDMGSCEQLFASSSSEQQRELADEARQD